MGEPFGRNRILASWFGEPEDTHGATASQSADAANIIAQNGLLAQRRHDVRASLDFMGGREVPALPRAAQSTLEAPVARAADTHFLTNPSPATFLPSENQLTRAAFTMPAHATITARGAADKTDDRPDFTTTLTDFRLESTPKERAETRTSAYDRIDFIRNSDESPSRLWLKNNGYLHEFQHNLHSSTETWLPDGRYSCVLRTGNGFGQTIVLNCDGSNTQRITAPDGKVLAQFTSTGKILEPGRKDTLMSA
jgi:hypothetical protein